MGHASPHRPAVIRHDASRIASPLSPGSVDRRAFAWDMAPIQVPGHHLTMRRSYRVRRPRRDCTGIERIESVRLADKMRARPPEHGVPRQKVRCQFVGRK